MSAGVKISGGAFRVALIGVATILLGGCSETGQFGNSFGTPYASNNPRIDRTPTGSVSASPSPASQVSNFFSDAFRPFGAPPSPPPAQPRHKYASQYRAPDYNHPIPPEPIASAPLAPPSQVASYPARAAASGPAERPTYALRTNPNAVGGWSAEGGTPIVLAQGETAEIIAQRYGVPVATLLTLNGYGPHARLEPGSRLTIPVYRAGGARTAMAPPAHAPQRIAPTEHQRYGARSLVGEELAQTTNGKRLHWSEGKAPARSAEAAGAARKYGEEARRAEKQARLAEENAVRARAAQLKAEKEKSRLARAEGGAHSADAARKAAEAKAAREAARLAAREAAKEARAAREAQAKADAAAKVAEAAPKARMEKTQVAETPKVASTGHMTAIKDDRDPTASLPPPTRSASADAADPEFRWPARGRVIQGFGSGGNDGINIAVPDGTQVKAVENGTVVYAGNELKGYGNLVLIRHPNGFVSAYANNGSLEVKRGQTVRRGQTIALSGQSGDVSSPQLHFELRKGSKPVDPSKYLAGL
jgi:murein DD-endopeptidase MepM/ murein hydrolase activator NlpD